MRSFRNGIALAFGAFLLLAISCAVPGLAQDATASSQHDQQIQSDVTHTLRNGRFKDVKVAVRDGIVTLTGTVNVYSVKRDAENRVHRRKNVRGVEDLITVVGPHVDDETLRSKLAEKLVYDRVGYGTTAFNSFTISVENGVVTLGGVAYGPVDKDSAVSLVSNYPGVRDVVDKIHVAPLSPADDRIRLEEARAIYGAPQLNKYAMDPAKPIRITVENGNVTLTGMVNNQGDKDVANIKANGVPGVFKVVNLLQVAGGAKKEK
ncbi:BON domain-containing protein [Edaphobacter sp.]|uniref:BON domain-containing protein n=1 Tax=Edaphobacter sp. TaxID=1934404 RepID=UPI002DBD8927|nr:BON domain-containing protein [Edaphobacter sp.]HEU5341947.1 BON domain-containing protein [Edaphobacter sp.]